MPRRGIVAILGANGAGKTTTLKAVSNLLHAERGEVTKGSIEFEGERIERLSPNDLVRRGCIQVLEGRHCFGHLTIEENLLTGAFTRKDGSAAIKADMEKVYNYFPRLRERRSAMAGYTSGGEQQMCAIGRAPDEQAQDDPARRALHGAGAADRRGNLRDRAGDLNAKGRRLLPAGGAEYQHGVALCDLRLHSWKPGRVVMDGEAKMLRENEDVKEFLPRHLG